VVELGGGASCLLVASLLQLRGAADEPPLRRADDGSLLCFNGEVFGGLDVPDGLNDGAALLRALTTAGAAVPAVLSSVRGPWALAFWHAPLRTLYFGRDVLGRRSLLLQRTQPGRGGSLVLASTAPLGEGGSPGGLEELPPGLYSVCLADAAPTVQLHAWEEAELCSLALYTRCEAPLARCCEEELLLRLDASVAVRVRACRAPASPGAASVMVAFSGGLDSALLAALAHRHVPPGEPIHLASVCFSGGASADRLAARSALSELRETAPSRPWRLICVDASMADVHAHRQHLMRLLYPQQTLMDLNIGAALWLTARGEGLLDGEHVRSSARVVLFGAGADEQAAGYGRHRTAWASGGAERLTAELEEDVRRLWRRNLGRDDRLVADCSREARFPFLDERVVALLASVPLSELADFAQPPGEGDKRLLRAAARSLGLPLASRRVKRAIQFGCGIGRLSRPSEGQQKEGGRSLLQP